MDIKIAGAELIRFSVAQSGRKDTRKKMKLYEERMYRIFVKCCEYYGQNQDQVMTRSRKEELKHTRFVAIYLVTEMFPRVTLKQIGGFFNGIDHSSVIHARDQIRNAMDSNFPDKKQIRKDVQQIMLSL